MRNVDSFKENWEFQLQYKAQVKAILVQLALKHPYIFFNVAAVEDATIEQDTKEATDMVVKIEGMAAIQCRTRDLETMAKSHVENKRDLTIRSHIQAQRTELEKMREGHGDYFIYAWVVDSAKTIAEWIFVDLGKMRQTGVLDNPTGRNIPNKDGRTWFHAYSMKRLMENDCIIDHNCEHCRRYEKTADLLQPQLF